VTLKRSATRSSWPYWPSRKDLFFSTETTGLKL
jgi:hypothetical protein